MMKYTLSNFDGRYNSKRWFCVLLPRRPTKNVGDENVKGWIQTKFLPHTRVPSFLHVKFWWPAWEQTMVTFIYSHAGHQKSRWWLTKFLKTIVLSHACQQKSMSMFSNFPWSSSTELACQKRFIRKRNVGNTEHKTAHHKRHKIDGSQKYLFGGMFGRILFEIYCFILCFRKSVCVCIGKRVVLPHYTTHLFSKTTTTKTTTQTRTTTITTQQQPPTNYILSDGI